MGYAGYAPTKYAAEYTAAEKALRSVKNTASLEMIMTLLKNAAISPKETKFRRIRLTNPKIAAAIVQVPAAMEALAVLGWIVDPSDAEYYIIPEGTYMTMKEVRFAQEALEAWQKEAPVPGVSGSVIQEVDPEKAKLRAQLEADKLERAAREPVTQSAMAKQVGGQPPTIRSGRDIGC